MSKSGHLLFLFLVFVWFWATVNLADFLIAVLTNHDNVAFTNVFVYLVVVFAHKSCVVVFVCFWRPWTWCIYYRWRPWQWSSQAGRQRQSNGQANYCLQSLTASLQVTNLLKKPDTDWVFTADYSHKILPIPKENINHTLTISFFTFWLFNINLLGIDNLKYQWARKSSVGDCKSTNLYKAPFTQFCPWDQTTV